MGELLVGRVLEVSDHPGARAPSLLLRMDFGPRGEYEVQVEPGPHDKTDFVGRLFVASLSGGGAIALMARSHEQGAVLVAPVSEVDAGTLVA